jgi:GntR family transcriptional repressor for pyruvate dehydrogenase complex
MEKKRAELVHRLMNLIKDSNRFPDGKLPPEREFAASLSVSRNLLREAMITLESAGYLDIRERQGAYIQRPTMADFSASLKYIALWPEDMLIHLMDMRSAIEPPIAALSAERRSDDDLERMRECIHMLELVQASPDRGISSGAQWDSMLHKLIVDSARNPLLTRLYEGLSATMERYIDMSRTLLLRLEDWPSKILGEHREIVEAIARNDAAEAAAAQKKHLESALSQLKSMKRPRTG